MITEKKDKITGDSLGVGRRKSSVARVRVREGNGKITINRKSLENFFPNLQDRNAVLAALKHVDKESELDVIVRVHGGGTTGQAGAISLGIARAIFSFDNELHDTLRDGGFLTRDSRMKERKKPGLHGARRGTQFSKR